MLNLLSLYLFSMNMFVKLSQIQLFRCVFLSLIVGSTDFYSYLFTLRRILAEMCDSLHNGSTKNVKNSDSKLSEEEEEIAHFYRILNAFKYYKTHSLTRVLKTERYFSSLPEHHQQLLKNYKKNLDNIKQCIEMNDKIIRLIIQDVAHMFDNTCSINPGHVIIRGLRSHGVSISNEVTEELAAIGKLKAEEGKSIHPQPNISDLEKVQATLKQFVRDWSEEGASERESCYQPIIDQIVSHFPPESCSTEDVKILVPGAGLGRLAFEIATRGYTCQGNEFSLFMLFASNFILNKCQQVNKYEVYPWVHQYVNNMYSADQTHGVYFPDVNPSSVPRNVQFSMVAGDFLEVYVTENEWDCVATCFFIDCANNVVAFMETIYHILKPGGLWINLGPLLYHYSDLPNEKSIEPSYEELKEVINGLGFITECEKTHVKTQYAQNPKAMLKCEYDSVFFVCRKPGVSIASRTEHRKELEIEMNDESMDDAISD